VQRMSPAEFSEDTGHLYHRLADRTGTVDRLLVGIPECLRAAVRLPDWSRIDSSG